MLGFVAYLLLFLGIGVVFIFAHLMIGKLIRPVKPDPEKMTIYECGEPTIGSAWIQFDLRFYVVALLFVIFDVEVAFFFPWAVVFGSLMNLAKPDLTIEQRIAATALLEPNLRDLMARAGTPGNPSEAMLMKEISNNQGPALSMAWIAFGDIVVFFAVLLVGFAYLWKRGDLDWVRSTAAERSTSQESQRDAPEAALAGASR